MTDFSVLVPSQPSTVGEVRSFGRSVDELGLSRMWVGQSFNIESHMALAALGDAARVPVGIGTSLAALRTPYDAALQARSLAALLDQPVRVAYGAADPDFVRSVRGEPLARPASFTAEYARIVRDLLQTGSATSIEAGLATDATLPPMDTPSVEVGTGVLRTGMARKSSEVVDFVVTWLTPQVYLRDELLPSLRREDGTLPQITTYVACAVERPGRSAQLMAQAGTGNHLARQHYADMLRRAGMDVHLSDPISGTREVVRHGIFLYGDADTVAAGLRSYADYGVDEVVLNLTPVALVYGIHEVMRDLYDIARALGAERTAHAV